MTATANNDTLAHMKQQKERWDSLREKSTRISGELGARRQQLHDAREEAVREFGTSDLEALRAEFAKREASNDQVFMEFIMELDRVDAALAEIDRQLKA